MLAHKYQVWPKYGWGDELDPEHPNEKRFVGITALAKRDRESPFEVFNEVVGARLGQLIGLPVPPGVVVDKDGFDYFCSLHVSAACGELPRCDFPRFTREREDEACGVTLFDAWIGNNDRHDENIWYDYYGNNLFLFDHGRALLGTSGRQNLLSNRTRLSIRVDPPCIADHLTTLSYFWSWYDRINSVETSAIREAVREAGSLGVRPELAHECGEWLIARRTRLPELFREATSVFPKLQPSLLDPFRNNDDCSPEYHI